MKCKQTDAPAQELECTKNQQLRINKATDHCSRPFLTIKFTASYDSGGVPDCI